MKKKILTLSLVFYLHLSVFAQFNEAVGTDKVQWGKSVQTLEYDSGFIIAGMEDWDAITSGSSDASITHAGTDGSVYWSKVYGGNNAEWFNSIRAIPFKSTPGMPYGYAALGMSKSFSSSADMFFVRTGPSGWPIFSFVFGKEKDEIGHCLQYIKDTATGKYGYVMVGQSNSYPYFAGNDIIVVKVDEAGNFIKGTVMGGPGEDIGYWIEQTNDGGFIVAGYTTSKTCARIPGNKDIFVIRLDYNLNIVWNTIIGHETLSADDIAYAVIQDPTDNSFTVTGITKSFGVSDAGDSFLLNLNPMGGLNWMKTYGGQKKEQGNSIHLSRTKCGEVAYIVAGISDGSSGSEDAYVYKTDRLGNLAWTFVYGTATGVEGAAEITGDQTDGYIFTGLANANFTNNTDIYLVNINSDGKSGSCEEPLYQLEKKQFPCLYSSLGQWPIDDIKRVQTPYKHVDYTAKKCDSYSVSPGSRADSLKTGAFIVTPNPASNSVSIQSSTSNIKGSHLKILNRAGNVVLETSVTEDRINIPISGLPPDLYIIHFITRDGNNLYDRFIKE